jgi:hypothetical protein
MTSSENSHGGDPARAAVEALAVEGYRSHTLSEEQIRRMLGFDSRWDVHAFLKDHGVYLAMRDGTISVNSDDEYPRSMRDPKMRERRRDAACGG